MTRHSRSWLTIAAFAIAGTAITGVAHAQTATKAPPPNAQVPVPPSQRPAPAPVPLTANPAPVPPEGAVALCMDNTFVKDPGTVADCSKHGGLRAAMTPHGTKTITRKSNSTLGVTNAAVNQAPPAGATMHCKDGTYLTGAPSKDRCANNGGLAAILPAPVQTPSVPARRP